jgi:hypothetical protein
MREWDGPFVGYFEVAPHFVRYLRQSGEEGRSNCTVDTQSDEDFPW